MEYMLLQLFIDGGQETIYHLLNLRYRQVPLLSFIVLVKGVLKINTIRRDQAPENVYDLFDLYPVKD